MEMRFCGDTLTRMHARTHSCLLDCARTHARTHACTCARMHARTHARTHSHMCAYAHICMQVEMQFNDDVHVEFAELEEGCYFGESALFDARTHACAHTCVHISWALCGSRTAAEQARCAR